MSPFKITFGIFWRLAAVLFFWVSIVFCALYTPVPAGAVLAGIAAFVVMLAVIVLGIRLIAADQKKRFALASVLANGSFALMVLSIVVTDPGLWLGRSEYAYIRIIQAITVIGFAFFTYRRWHQLQDGSYLARFEPKPKRPSPFAVLKRED